MENTNGNFQGVCKKFQMKFKRVHAESGWKKLISSTRGPERVIHGIHVTFWDSFNCTSSPLINYHLNIIETNFSTKLRSSFLKLEIVLDNKVLQETLWFCALE